MKKYNSKRFNLYLPLNMPEQLETLRKHLGYRSIAQTIRTCIRDAMRSELVDKKVKK